MDYNNSVGFIDNCCKPRTNSHSIQTTKAEMLVLLAKLDLPIQDQFDWHCQHSILLIIMVMNAFLKLLKGITAIVARNAGPFYWPPIIGDNT